MNRECREIINKLTMDILDCFKIEIPIVDMENIVKTLGGRVEISCDIETVIDKSLQREGDGFKIFISLFQSEERKRFTIAHELGHLFLHMGYKIDDKLWNETENLTYYRSGSSVLEYEANEFAAALLMPKDVYKKVMNENLDGNIVNTSKIAEFFGVSILAASNRGKFLGYFA